MGRITPSGLHLTHVNPERKCRFRVTKSATMLGPSTGVADRLWAAARVEFSMRGYHGARVQAIARRAACNVALLYRHWSSKQDLYLAILRSVWESSARAFATLAGGGHGPEDIIAASLDSMLADPAGAQILVREYLDGAPCLGQLVASDPALADPVRQAARALADGDGRGLRPAVDPMLAVLTIGGVSALCASATESSRIFLEAPVSGETWRRHILDVLLNGLSPASR